MNIRPHIHKVPDFPTEGVVFWDITPLLANAEALRKSIEQMALHYKGKIIDKVASPEARGFLIGPALAKELNAGFIPIRKPGKLPRKTVQSSYDLEYGSDQLHMHEDAIEPGERILIADDILATGGTAEACAHLVERQGGQVEGFSFLISLEYLSGKNLLKRYDIYELLNLTKEDVYAHSS
ncbi:adenine phosphoribosyltransferase [Candidatus Peregrinibacteria bacterium CG22_combo_CG10-13_8_21_14_all_49_11]|nr:MAG: adenine phosphoribosyltransferase [Candidatus Peregrinibacteria bacterium CG22_combo_CG10-13_8_21_14_all_49_11]